MEKEDYISWMDVVYVFLTTHMDQVSLCRCQHFTGEVALLNFSAGFQISNKSHGLDPDISRKIFHFI